MPIRPLAKKHSLFERGQFEGIECDAFIIRSDFCSNEYYGGLWASFNLDGLQQWVEDCKKPKDETECAAEPQLADGESAVKMRVNNPPTATNVVEQWHVPE